MKYFILALLLAVAFIACNDGSNPNRPTNTYGMTVKVADYEVTPPEECVKVLNYYVLQETNDKNAWDVVKCVDMKGRRSVFYKSFAKTEWNKRYLRD